MNLKEIRQEAWDIAREIGTSDADRYWTTKEMNRYINRIYRYIAKETKCIRDSQTHEICNIGVEVRPWQDLTVDDGMDYVWANDPSAWLYQKDVAPYVFALDDRILQIDEAKWTIKQWRLTKVSYTKWSTNPWWEQVIGLPTEYSTDYSNNKLALNFRATDTDTLRLIVRRLPLIDLKNDTDVPELRTNYHDLMINGILWQMYKKQDVEVADREKADSYYALFMKDVDEIKQQEASLDNRLRPNFSVDAFR